MSLSPVVGRVAVQSRSRDSAIKDGRESLARAKLLRFPSIGALSLAFPHDIKLAGENGEILQPCRPNTHICKHHRMEFCRSSPSDDRPAMSQRSTILPTVEAPSVEVRVSKALQEYAVSHLLDRIESKYDIRADFTTCSEDSKPGLTDEQRHLFHHLEALLHQGEALSEAAMTGPPDERQEVLDRLLCNPIRSMDGTTLLGVLAPSDEDEGDVRWTV